MSHGEVIRGEKNARRFPSCVTRTGIESSALASTSHWWSPLKVPLKGEMAITKMDSDPLEQGHLPKVYCYLILEPKSGFSWQGMEGCCMGGPPAISSTVRTFLLLHSLYHLEPRITGELK